MNSHSPETEELRQTIDHLEQRLGLCNSNRTNELMGHYWALVARLEVDFRNERDRLLARSGALALIQMADPGEAPDD